MEQAEENNRQLLNLLEKYDNKLDELQEDNELKDMKIFEYERVHLGDRPQIHIESIEDKIKFLVQVLKRLRTLYVVDAQERIEQQKKAKSEEVEYPRQDGRASGGERGGWGGEVSGVAGACRWTRRKRADWIMR